MPRSPKRQKLDRGELLNNLNDYEVESCLKLASWRSIAPGGFLFQEGELGDALYMVSRGRLRLYQVSPGGRQALLRFANPGELIGYWPWLREPRYAASAQAVLPVQAMAWSRRAFSELMERYPQLAFGVVRTLAQELEELSERYLYQATQPVPQRIAWAVLRLQEQSATGVQQPLIFPRGFTLKDVAEMAGTTIYTVSRVLGLWKQKGLVTKHLREYIAYDVQRFAELART